MTVGYKSKTIMTLELETSLRHIHKSK